MLIFHCLSFDKLSNNQLYELLQLRQEVFIVEQDCPYLDADDNDQASYHILGIDADGKLQAYTRIMPPGSSYEKYSSIGRVITSSAIRGQKQGVPLMQFSIDKTIEYWPNHSIKISAQTYIVKFYNSLGFKEVGEEYLEDDLPHIAMIRE
ncbi:MAG: ElaA protein [Saprospiraceae bacterium]|jgi:ElaA protein|tara:strand:- start:1409 stop:1858 length:450 start_codon:yes stop_codon:yes gene_type:complete